MVEREAWIVFDEHDQHYTIAGTEGGAKIRHVLAHEQQWEHQQKSGFTCRRVRITEITDDQP